MLQTVAPEHLFLSQHLGCLSPGYHLEPEPRRECQHYELPPAGLHTGAQRAKVMF